MDFFRLAITVFSVVNWLGSAMLSYGNLYKLVYSLLWLKEKFSIYMRDGMWSI